MTPDLLLCLDVGTGSVRAAAVDTAGRIVRVASREHEQIVPRFGWAEQRADSWWDGVVATVRELVDALPDLPRCIAAVAACGQMHGTVLIDADGQLTRETVPLWNDKRTAEHVAAFERAHRSADYLTDSGSPASPSWPGFKLAWLRDNEPGHFHRAATVLMPKDYVNFRLTGERAMDRGDGSLSFLMDPVSGDWSPVMAERLGLDLDKLPPLRGSLDLIGAVTAVAAGQTGLRAGTPVLVGAADYPAALLGSGVCRPGLASDVTGTSCIVTIIAPAPILNPTVCNVATIEGGWGGFVLLETGGDAVRWARRALHDGRHDYASIMDRAATAPAGSDGLLFLPYLTGERLGEARNARAQFFGLAAAHGLEHLDRAMLEGVAFAATRALRIMEAASGCTVEHIVASSGGAKSALWLKIKASAYDVPLLVPEEAECGIVGCAIMAATALGHYSTLDAAVSFCVRHSAEIKPEPAWAARYKRMQPVFDRLYQCSQALYDALDEMQ